METQYQAVAKPSRSKASSFGKGSGVYACRSCGRSTRSTGRQDNEHAELCAECFDLGGFENAVADGETLSASELADCRRMVAIIESKGGVADFHIPALALPPSVEEVAVAVAVAAPTQPQRRVDMETKQINPNLIAIELEKLFAIRPTLLCQEGKDAQELLEVASRAYAVGRKLWTLAKEAGAVAGSKGKRRDSKASEAEPVSQDAVTDEEQEDAAAEAQEQVDGEAMKEESRVIRLGEKPARPDFENMPTADLVRWFNEHAAFNTPFGLKLVERFSTRDAGIKRCAALFANIDAE